MDARTLFPALDREIYGKPLIYFDNAATSQRPRTVLDLQQRLSVEANANIHRAVHKLSADATEAYEAGREAVRRHINAPGRENVVFTSGTTASINLVATCFTERYVVPGDRILISEAEHHSNLVPWQMACARHGASLDVLPVDDAGEISLEALEKNPAVDIVLTDMWMPVMDGEGLIREIRAREQLKDLPVYAVTADVETQKTYKASGFTGILLKPVTLDQLQVIVG